MRLITKTTLLYLLLSMAVFGIGGLVAYPAVMDEVAVETDYSLIYNFRIIEQAMIEGQSPDVFINEKVSIVKLFGVPQLDTNFVFSDTMAIHPQLKREELHRLLVTNRTINEEHYYFKIMEAFIEEDDVEEGIIDIFTRLFLVLSLVIIIASFLISKKLFQPFQDILQRIGHFKLSSQDALNLPQTNTKEFRELNEFITQMTSKARKDYQTLKEFSENASHEMQTPIAVAKGKLELLLEYSDLKPEHLKLIQSAQNSLTKLSKMGQSLSLLTKIDNQEFSNQRAIDFSKAVESVVSDFSELCQLKGLILESEVKDNVYLKIDESLADILIGNLLKNALQHNISNGNIKVHLDNEKLEISNTGMPLSISTSQLFERFRKNNQSSSSLGLGLSIVKKICEVNGFEVSYHFKHKNHILTIFFGEQQ